MPTYIFKCECGSKEEVFRSITNKDPVPCSCGLEMQKEFAGGGTFFVEGSTPSKAWKEKRVRHKRNAELSLKQIERYGSGPSLTPNIGGVEVDTWDDAKALAKESGINTEGYDDKIQDSQNRDNSQGIDEVKWKKAKEDLKHA